MDGKFKQILIAPLDWGLGHATRCIPLIRLFQEKGRNIAIATSGDALALLRREFPKLTFFELPAYDVRYEFESMAVNMMLQLPKLRSVIMRENQALKNIISDFQPDLIVSDNRYGIHHPDIPSVFLGHQLAIQMPNRVKVFSKLTSKWHAKMLEPFNQIWVPDFIAHPNLSGDLSHGVRVKTPVFFIGPLSRFKFDASIEEDLPLLILLSGQEPRRTVFEEQIINQLADWKEEVILLRGLPNEKESLKSPYPNLKIFNHLESADLEQLILRAKRIVSRSGYSSIMDYSALHKKVLFIPTKGQTEQEYLARYLSKTGHALYALEDKLDLVPSLNQLDLMLPLKLENHKLEFLLNQALKEL